MLPPDFLAACAEQVHDKCLLIVGSNNAVGLAVAAKAHTLGLKVAFGIEDCNDDGAKRQSEHPEACEGRRLYRYDSTTYAGHAKLFADVEKWEAISFVFVNSSLNGREDGKTIEEGDGQGSGACDSEWLYRQQSKLFWSIKLALAALADKSRKECGLTILGSLGSFKGYSQSATCSALQMTILSAFTTSKPTAGDTKVQITMLAPMVTWSETTGLVYQAPNDVIATVAIKALCDTSGPGLIYVIDDECIYAVEELDKAPSSSSDNGRSSRSSADDDIYAGAILDSQNEGRPAYEFVKKYGVAVALGIAVLASLYLVICAVSRPLAKLGKESATDILHTARAVTTPTALPVESGTLPSLQAITGATAPGVAKESTTATSLPIFYTRTQRRLLPMLLAALLFGTGLFQDRKLGTCYRLFQMKLILHIASLDFMS